MKLQLNQSFLNTSIFCLIFLVTPQVFSQVTILHNHIGYDTNSPKQFVIKGLENDIIDSFSIVNFKTKETVFEGTPEKVGKVDKWRDWVFWTGRFDELREDGQFIIKINANQNETISFPFKITKNLLQKNTLSDVIYYFKGQRCTGLLDKADRTIPFKGGEYENVDVHGGWYDATGDYSKDLSHLSFSTYFNPQQTSLTAWALFESFETIKSKSNPNFNQYLRRLLDEAMYGADFLVRIHNKDGSFYRTISGSGPGKLPKDRRITPVMTGFKIKKTKPEETDVIQNYKTDNSVKNNYDVSYRAGGGLSIAALARASTYNVSGDFNNSKYLEVAEQVFKYLENHNLELTNDGIENIVDDYCALIASTELYKATKKNIYKISADKSAESLMNRLVSKGKYHNYWRADENKRSFFHASDAGLPIVSLIKYLEITDDKEAVLNTIKKSLEFEIDVTLEVKNPFGYSRQVIETKNKGFKSSFFFPHDSETAPWWQGENARLSSIATAAYMAKPHFSSNKEFTSKLESLAINQLDWILGKNPFDSCMMQGKGRNNVQYLFFESYEYSPAPGGIVNGITSGLYDENDIDFNRGYLETGEDNDWRWAEQWLPHATWYLLAISHQ